MKSPTRAFTFRREENIRTGLKETGCDVEWVHVGQDRGQLRALVNTLTNLRVPEETGEFN
jgi:hypothetical protein